MPEALFNLPSGLIIDLLELRGNGALLFQQALDVTDTTLRLFMVSSNR